MNLKNVTSLFYKKSLDPSPSGDGKPCFEEYMAGSARNCV